MFKNNSTLLVLIVLIIYISITLVITVYDFFDKKETHQDMSSLLTFGGTRVIDIIDSDKKEKININTCSIEALINLPDIGNILATRIVENRPYLDIYELTKIEGIGKIRFEAIKEFITCTERED